MGPEGSFDMVGNYYEFNDESDKGRSIFETALKGAFFCQFKEDGIVKDRRNRGGKLEVRINGYRKWESCREKECEYRRLTRNYLLKQRPKGNSVSVTKPWKEDERVKNCSGEDLNVYYGSGVT